MLVINQGPRLGIDQDYVVQPGCWVVAGVVCVYVCVYMCVGEKMCVFVSVCVSLCPFNL